MTLRHDSSHLVWPAGQKTPPTDAEVTATLALFDAIAMDHEVLAGYALAQGARLDALAHWPEQPDKEPMGPLERAVHRACWASQADGKTLSRGPHDLDGPRSETVNVLVNAGARSLNALFLFHRHWLYDSANAPLDDPMVRLVEASSLDALLNERRGSPAFRFVDPDGDTRSVRSRIFGIPHDSWLSVAARHRRLDVISHWFAQGGALNHEGLLVFKSPLLAAFEAIPGDREDDPAVREVLLAAWKAAPDALYRQEALHLLAGQTKLPAPLAQRLNQAMVQAIEERPIDLHLTPTEEEALKTAVRPAAVKALLHKLEDAVLRHEVRALPAEKPRDRVRL